MISDLNQAHSSKPMNKTPNTKNFLGKTLGSKTNYAVPMMQFSRKQAASFHSN